MKPEVGTPEEVGMRSKRLERIKPVMQAYVDQKKIAGLNTMLARQGNPIDPKIGNP